MSGKASRMCSLRPTVIRLDDGDLDATCLRELERSVPWQTMLAADASACAVFVTYNTVYLPPIAHQHPALTLSDSPWFL